MKVGIDCQILPGQGGAGEYTIGLVRQLLKQGKNDYVIFTNKLTRQRLGDVLSKGQAVNSDTSPVSLKWLAYNLPRALNKYRIQIYHAPAFLLPFKKVCPYLVTVHDMIYRLFPDTMTWKRRLFWKALMPNTWRQADYVFADSRSTKDDIVRLVHYPENRIEILPAAIDETFYIKVKPDSQAQLRKKYNLPKSYFLCVGTLEPRKNICLTLEGFREYRKAGGSFELVIVGPQGWMNTPMFKVLRELELTRVVHFTGWVEPNDLSGIYQQAYALLFPSKYEGFGLPILEAMAGGTPVITSKVSSLPEVGGIAALYIDTMSGQNLAGLMLKLERDKKLYSECVTEGFRQIQCFSWEKSAVQAGEAYARIMRGAGLK